MGVRLSLSGVVELICLFSTVIIAYQDERNRARAGWPMWKSNWC